MKRIITRITAFAMAMVLILVLFPQINNVKVHAAFDPIGLASPSQSANSITLTWGISDPLGKLPSATWELRMHSAVINENTIASAQIVSRTIPTNIAGSSYTYTVGALNPDTIYHFAVRHFPESQVPGNLQAMSARTAKPLAVPSAPSNLRAVPGNGSVVLSWSAPSGSVLDYNIITSPVHVLDVTQLANSTTRTIVGLSTTPPTNYTFTITARNALGTSASASIVATPTSSPPPQIKPSKPTGTSSASGDNSVTLTWTPPSGAILDYEIGISELSGIPKQAQTATSSPYTVTGLSNGTAYNFSITARNTTGVTGYSTGLILPTMPMPPLPGTPTNVLSQPGNTQLTVSWAAPTSGGPIDNYVISLNPPRGGGPGEESITVYGTSKTITGLTNEIPYIIRVSAVNLRGSVSAEPITSTPIPPPPGTPTITAAVPGSTQVALTWSAPISGGAPSGYQVEITPQGGTSEVRNFGQTSLTQVITGLINGTLYTFKVRATNSGGTGEYSNPVNSTPIAPVPGAPTLLSAVPGSGSVTLTWSAATFGGSPTGYEVSVITDTTTLPLREFNNNTSLTQEITGLANGTLHHFKVRARNSGGASAFSNQISATPVALNLAPIADAKFVSPPPQPLEVGVVIELTGLDSFDPEGGQIIYSWSFVSEPPGLTGNFSAPATALTTFIPQNSGTYTLQLVVTDDQGLTNLPQQPSELQITVQAPINLPPTVTGNTPVNPLSTDYFHQLEMILSGIDPDDFPNPLTYEVKVQGDPPVALSPNEGILEHDASDNSMSTWIYSPDTSKGPLDHPVFFQFRACDGQLCSHPNDVDWEYMVIQVTDIFPDLDGDLDVDRDDLALIYEVIANRSQNLFDKADVNFDGQVNVIDMVLASGRINRP